MEKLDTLKGTLSQDPSIRSCITHWETIPAKSGEFVPFPEELFPLLKESLRQRGLSALYTHQKQSYDAVRAGKNVVVVTPTASGKTLCYNLPVLQTLLEDKDAKALYLFPTKALSQDQQAEINTLVLGGNLPVQINIYDGDTPSSLRVSAREAGRIIISNPDMLHSGILPNHPKWIKFLKSIAIIVIDEVHIYRGVFGSHMTNVIRRLKRILRFYGADPVFICCSATIGNPKELAERIIEEETLLVNEDGSPKGEKHIVFYNPPLVDPVQGIRRGVVLESKKLGLKFLKQGIKTIIFSRSRVRTELIASYLKKSLYNRYNDNNRIVVESYRGGYLPGERRRIEEGLRSGAIKGVVSTNALELGIDIGGLDVSILAGFPGSIASTLQQAGRAGRRNSSSLAVLIASASPIDQYILHHPEYFFSRSPENGWIDPNNLYILMNHLKCAVFELPFREGEQFGGNVHDLLSHLEDNGVVRFAKDAWYWSEQSYPAEQISLRSSASQNVVIINITQGKNEVIGEMDRPSAKELLFKNAVYIHRGDQYLVKTLDIEGKKCLVEETALNYYTDSIVKRDIKVLYEDEHSRDEQVSWSLGDILVRTQVAKFKKIKFGTHENLGYGEIYIPEEEMHTRGIMLLFSPRTLAGKLFETLSPGEQEQLIARIGTLIRNVAPVFLLCDTRDLGVAERLRDPHFSLPAVYIYDVYPGGIGLAEGIKRNLISILLAARELVNSCSCSHGCPSCVGPLAAVEGREQFEGNPKEVMLRFLQIWLGNAKMDHKE